MVRGPLGLPRLTLSPGRLAPEDPAWADGSKPLAGELRWRSRPLFVIATRFAFRVGDDPFNGRFQPPTSPTDARRHQQARLIAGFADRLRDLNPGAMVVVLGFLNDFEFSRTADLLVRDGDLVDLPRTLPARQRYTYVSEGNSLVLDHILISPALAQQAGAQSPYDYDVVHVNAEYVDQLSDHDPQVVRIRP